MSESVDPLARMRALQALDLPVHGGRTLAYVYDSGDDEVDRIAREAVAAYAGSNALDPTAFPSLLTMENELVGFAAGLLDAPDTVVGTVTSGGTESILLAVQGARDSRPDVPRPRMVLPSTAHAAFHKAAHYFGVEPVLVPVDAGFRADATAMAAAIDDSTVLVVASAPSYAHGVVDPVAEIAAAAAAAGVRCHVDACIGGWVLPYAARLGRPVAPWTFAVDGVTSISVDTHKYAYAPRAPRCCCTATPACADRSSSPPRPGPATRCSTRRPSRPVPADPSPAPGRWSRRSATPATSDWPRTSSRLWTTSSPRSLPSLR
ncbi:aminotransferase class V-fold PLP-dependent enzyme [Nocardioides piscis]|uniref:aminotransferase class V-fold PLP-dependent enzyme n=1 Tax=Nocardioides piscis TaxID=2714938 RepID=UPI001FE4730A|nr:aminotransferase class V-fold PLP-dependent enzyme [Nocardioides piscis]